MTKKHYIKLAEIIKSNSDDMELNINWDNFLIDLTTYLKEDNPNFNEQKFYDAINVDKRFTITDLTHDIK